MTIRFLQVCPSENPEFPFQPGQIITVDEPSSFLLALVDGVRAQVVPTDVLERAVDVDAEQPEPVKRKGRRGSR